MKKIEVTQEQADAFTDLMNAMVEARILAITSSNSEFVWERLGSHLDELNQEISKMYSALIHVGDNK